MIKVSVIVPIYNVEKYLDRCLSSIIAQTYQHLEIILIDDGSTDRSADICDNFATKDNRISVVHKKNEGPSAARNMGVKTSSGDYILFVDSDDELPLNAINLLIEKSKEYSQAELIIGEIHSIPDDFSWYPVDYYKKFDYVVENAWIRQHFFRFHDRLPTNPVNKLIRRDFIIKNELYFREGIIHEDELWMFNVVLNANKISFLHEDTYKRYINPGSIMTGSSNEKKNDAWNHIFCTIFQTITDPLWDQQFFFYLTLLKDKHRSYTEQNPSAFEESWKKAIVASKKRGRHLLSFLLFLYIKTFPIIKGHGTGFILWLYTKINSKELL